MIYFISGHKDLTEEEFKKYYIPKIDFVLVNDTNAEFIIGDCDGVDTYAMNYIFNIVENPLTTCHKNKKARNLPLDYVKFCNILDNADNSDNFYTIGEFKSDEEQDFYMTEHSDFDIAYVKNNRWDSGTAKNIKRRNKIC